MSASASLSATAARAASFAKKSSTGELAPELAGADPGLVVAREEINIRNVAARPYA